MNILLVNAPSDHQGAAANKLGMWIPGEQLGICYLAACLRKEGFQVELIDAYLLGLSPQQVTDIILAKKGALDLVGLSISDGKIFGAAAVLKNLADLEHGIHLTLGGHTAALCAAEFLQDFPRVDSIVTGEGETTVVALCQALSAGRDWSPLPGLAYFRDGQFKKNPPAPLVDVEELPFPDRDALHLCQEVGFCVSIETSRGCKGVCSFCAARMMFRPHEGPSWRARSVDNLLAEIERLKVDHGIDKISFEDEDFLGFGSAYGIDRAVQFAEEILRRRLKISWSTLTRVDNIKKDVFALLKRAGLQLIFIGVENNGQSTLNRYRKGTTTSQNQKAIQILRELDIPYEILWIMYDPYTKLEDIRNTVLFFQEYATSLNINFYNPLRVYHGTPLHAKLAAEQRLTGTYLEYHYEFADPNVEAFMQAIKPSLDGLYLLITRLNYVLLDRQSYSTAEVERARAIAAKIDDFSKWYLDQVVQNIANNQPVDHINSILRAKTMELALETYQYARLFDGGSAHAVKEL